LVPPRLPQSIDWNTRQLKNLILYFFLTLVVFSPLCEKAENWSQFRGPNGSGVVDSAKPPTVFGPEENVRWKSAVPAGVSSPIVWEDRIFLTGTVYETLVTVAYDADNGRELWRREVQPEKLENTHAFSSAASSTPCTDGERVYVYFNSFGVVAYDWEGKEVW